MTAEREFAESVCKRLREAGNEAVFAGGCVRDLLRGVEPSDYDVATDATPDRVRELFGRKRTLAVGEAFGVIIVLGRRPPGGGPPTQVEVATFRTEGDYRDGRRPGSVAFCTAEEDARRRDFTINGLFLDPAVGEVLDYVGGRADLGAGVVRAIGVADDRFAEDRLRMLRAVRFAARFGFRLDNETAAAVRRHAKALRVVSRERVAQELSKMLTHPSRAAAVVSLVDLGLWPATIPEAGPPSDAALRRLEQLDGPSVSAALATLLSGEPAETVDATCRGLKLSNAVVGDAAWLAERCGLLSRWSELSLAERKRTLADPRSESLIAIERAGGECEGVEAAAAYKAATPEDVLDPPPLLTGGDLKMAGLQPSPKFKQMLEAVRAAQLNEEIATRDEALRLLGLS